MELTNIVSAVDGDDGASASIQVGTGVSYFLVSGTDFTGVTVALQYSHDDTTYVTVASKSAAGGEPIVLPEGYVRTNITGGGSGDAITVKHGQIPLVKGNFISGQIPVTATAS